MVTLSDSVLGREGKEERRREGRKEKQGMLPSDSSPEVSQSQALETERSP